MSKAVRASQQVSSEQLLAELGHQNAKRRILLVAVPKGQADLKRFLREFRVPAHALPEMVGSMFGYTNLEVFTPEGVAYFAIEALGSASIGWQLLADAARAQGYELADLRDNTVHPLGSQAQPVPLLACTGLLHNVRT
jgi:hypothetical protein